MRATIKAWAVALFVVLALCAGTARAEEWTGTQKAALAVAMGVHAADWLQTRAIARSGGQYVEVAPVTSAIIGSHPSTMAVDAYMAGTAVAVYLIADALPQYREAILAGWSASKLVLVINNDRIGISMSRAF